jgi:hypothetical protein
MPALSEKVDIYVLGRSIVNLAGVEKSNEAVKAYMSI